MATKHWIGNATPQALIMASTFGTYDVDTERFIHIGAFSVSRFDTGGDLTTALSLFATKLNASTHPYFAQITWSSDATNIYGTADVPGVPFVMTGAVGGSGAGTYGGTITTQSSIGPNDWSVDLNWSDGALPANGDTVILSNNSVNICWGLTTFVTGVTAIRMEQSYTGRIGLDYTAFATSLDGTQTDPSVPEYRDLYLSIGCTFPRIGDFTPLSLSTAGSQRLMCDFGSSTTTTVEIINTASTSADAGRPAVRLKFNKSDAKLNVRSAPGGVGVCAEVPGETSTMSTISVSDTGSQSKVITGPGLTLATWVQDGGNNVLHSDATVTTETINGGALRTEGVGAVTTMNVYSGAVTHNSTGTTATINVKGGEISSFGSATPRTWTTINLFSGSSISLDSCITYTTLAAQNRQVLTTA